jgi:curved DNA-binding protein CbpA
MNRPDSPHETLGVDAGASQKQVQAAYRRLVKELHPDRHPDDPERSQKEEKLKRVNVAYEKLQKGFAKAAGSAQESRSAPATKPRYDPYQRTPSDSRRTTHAPANEDAEAAAQRFWDAYKKARQQAKQ